MRLLLLFLLTLTVIQAQNREALLIGNYSYSKISQLNDTRSNLTRLQNTLKGLGFHVTVKSNLDAKHLKATIDNFKSKLARNHETIGFFYYSGHGCQMENVGYLIPTNIDSNKKLDVQFYAMNVDKMLQTFKEAGNRVNMIFLDACRNIPTGTKGGTKGLGQSPATPKGTLLVYATEAKKTADDNNNFIDSLIKQIKIPNKSIREIGFNISDDVALKTKEQQVPEVFAKRLPNLVLKRGYIAPQVEPQPNVVVPVAPTPKPRRVDSSTNNPNIVKIGNLMYQNQPFTKLYNWQGAKDYCEALTLGNYSDWRLPNINELKKLLTKNPSKSSKGYTQYIRKEFIENLPEYNGFWSSTVYEKDSSYAWFVDFNLGNDNWYSKSNSLYALCVR